MAPEQQVEQDVPAATVTAATVTAATPGRRGVLARRWAAARAGGEEGMSTAEYAVGTLAACGFSGVLYKVVTSPEVLGLLRDVIGKAFKLGF